jgi:hypothetical protein
LRKKVIDDCDWSFPAFAAIPAFTGFSSLGHTAPKNFQINFHSKPLVAQVI